MGTVVHTTTASRRATKPGTWNVGIVSQFLARFKAKKAEAAPVERPNPFKVDPKLHPPGVAKHAPQMAQDDAGALNEVGEWAAAAFASALHEGTTFVGYPFLAELAQRGEYRRAVEIIAMHMTRRWIKFKAAGEDVDEDEEDGLVKPDKDEKAKRPGIAKDLAPPPKPQMPGGEKPKTGIAPDPAAPTDEKDPAEEAAAKKRKAAARKIKQIERAIEKLNVKAAFRKIAEQDGFFGRAHLYLDFGKEVSRDVAELLTPIGDGSNELSREKCSPDRPLVGLKTIEAVWCYPTTYNASDPLSDDWYKPSTWSVMSKRIHSTRLLRFVGREVADLLKPTYSFGGVALTQMMKPYVDNWLRTRQSVADIVSAFSIFVLKTNLIEQLNAQGGQSDLFDRLDLFNMIRDNRGLMAIDKDREEFENVAAPLGTLDALQAQTQEHMSAISGIPIVELLGIQPAGLNASSEGELKVFREWIHAFQDRLFRDHLTTVIGFVQLSLFGAVDPELTFEFVPLEELNAKELAEVENIRAQTDSVLVEGGIIEAAEARQRLADDEDSPYHGIDPDAVPEPPEPEMPAPGGEGGDNFGEGGDNPDDASGGAKKAPETHIKIAHVAGGE